MFMQKEFICPHCGHHFVLPPAICVPVTEAEYSETVKKASDLGVEIGTMKGGEEIGY